MLRESRESRKNFLLSKRIRFKLDKKKKEKKKKTPRTPDVREFVARGEGERSNLTPVAWIRFKRVSLSLSLSLSL